MKTLAKFIFSAISVLIASYILPGIALDNIVTAFVVVGVMAICNVFLKPILILLTLPITVATLGLFLIVLNILNILIVAALVPGFKVDGFFSAMLFGLTVGITNYVFGSMVDKEDK